MSMYIITCTNSNGMNALEVINWVNCFNTVSRYLVVAGLSNWNIPRHNSLVKATSNMAWYPLGYVQYCENYIDYQDCKFLLPSRRLDVFWTLRSRKNGRIFADVRNSTGPGTIQVVSLITVSEVESGVFKQVYSTCFNRESGRSPKVIALFCYYMI